MSGATGRTRSAQASGPAGAMGGRAWMVAAGLAALGLYVLRQRLATLPPSIVDWDVVERIAMSRLRTAPGALSREELGGALPSYRAAMDRIVPLLEAELGSALPGVVERYAVVDRAAWVEANLGTFRELIGHLETALADELRPRRGDVGGAVMLMANRFLTTRQIGFLLAFMSQRVLGQYDLALLSAEAQPGQLLFVEENVRGTARQLGIPVDDMRAWVALHETTHAFEFEAHPWVRPYLRERLERQIAGFIEDARLLQARGFGALVRRWREGGEGAETWIESLMTAEQRGLFQETQVVMTLLEGFSDWVMDEIGAGLLPDVDRMRARFEERRGRRTPLERIFFRISGLDLKLEQYRRGHRFVSEVAAQGGREALARLWAGPHLLPRSDELDHTERWLARTAAPADGAA